MGRVDKTEKRWIPLLVAFLVALSVVTFTNPAPAQAAVSPDSFERCLLDKANQARAAAGVAPLKMADEVVPGVRSWSRTMRFNEFEHMTVQYRNGILPDSWRIWGENIAMHSNDGMPNCGPIHSLWMNSAGHRANILNPKFCFVAIGAYVDSSGWWATQLFGTAGKPCVQKDEIFFYRGDGLFRFYEVKPNGTLGSPIQAGSNYTSGWDSITAVDINGDGRDEMFFYRQDGLYRFYNVKTNGTLGSPIRAGDNYTSGWDSITAVDINGDGRDEMFFYRQDGLYRFYNVRANGTLGSPIRAGDNYTGGWDSIAAVDIDGDGRDEMFFYRQDGLYRFYNVRANGTLGSPIRAGDNYTSGWDSITAGDIDGDRRDEMFFYRQDGLHRFYSVRTNGTLGSPIRAGSDYTSDWDSITAVDFR